MTKEEILRSFLEDELFEEQNILKPGEVDKFKWSTPTSSKLIDIIKIAVDGELAKETSNITERKINQYLTR